MHANFRTNHAADAALNAVADSLVLNLLVVGVVLVLPTSGGCMIKN